MLLLGAEVDDGLFVLIWSCSPSSLTGHREVATVDYLQLSKYMLWWSCCLS